MKWINSILILITVVILFISVLWDINLLDYKKPIEHKNFKSITLANFYGLNRPFLSLHGQKEFAFISTDIHVKSKAETITVSAKFHPSRSYIFSKTMISESLLTHELYHFHITEYCARLLRQELSELKNKPKHRELKKLLNNKLNEERILQIQYDDETYHSYVLGKQFEWQDKVDSLLKSKEKFINEVVYFK